MHRNLVMKPYQFSSSFLSCEKDCEVVLRRLFIESRPYSDMLKRLLVINEKDCIDNLDSQVYNQKVNEMTLSKLREQNYIKLQPKFERPEHQEKKSYLVFNFDNFIPNPANPEFRNCNIMIDILCHPECWDIGNFRCRPLKIAGYIDGILNKAKLSGIGEIHFAGCSEIILDENLAGYTLIYNAVHGTGDDRAVKFSDIPPGIPVN